MITVSGATGNIGGELVRQLAERGVPARALTRDAARAELPPGVEVVEGDLARPDSLDSAWDGAQSVFFLPTGDEDTRAVLESMRRAGVGHVVMVSSLLAETDPDSPLGGAALRGERFLRGSGPAWTILRPWEFASNALWWAPSVREQGVVRTTNADAASPVIDPADIAAVAARALTEQSHTAAIYPLTGPEEVSPRERVHALGRALGRDLAVEEMAPEEGRAHLRRFMPPEVADSMIDADPRAGGGPGVLPTVEKLTGRPPRTFREWALAHAGAFR